MPFERRDIAERTIFPKHIFSLPPSTLQILSGAGEGARVYTAEVAAEDVPARSGLYTIDGVALQAGMTVFVHADSIIYTAQAGDWSVFTSVVAPAVVLVQRGKRWARSVHLVTEEGVGAHYAFVGRSGSVSYTLTPADWTLLQLTEALVESPDVTLAPAFQFTAAEPRRGIYAVHVSVYTVPSGTIGSTWTGTLSLAVLADGLPIPYEQPNDIVHVAIPGSAAALQASMLWRVEDETYTVGLRAAPAGEFEVKAYVGLHRLI